MMSSRHACALALSVASAVVASGQPANTNAPPAGASGSAPAESPSWAQLADRFGGVEWVTRPNRDVAMGFTIALEIREVLVKTGESVKAGQLLVRARDGEVLSGLAVQKARAENDTEVLNQQSAVELAQLRFSTAKDAFDKNAATKAEIDERRIALDSARIALAAAQKRLDEERLRLTQLQEQADRYYLKAPFDGQIDLVAAEAGEPVGENHPVIRVVNIDPLWVDVPIKTDETLALRLTQGHPGWALLDLPGDPAVLAAKVLFISPAADAASGTRRVRLEIPNPRQWPAGTRVRIRFTPPGPGWKIDSSAAPASAAQSARAPGSAHP